MYRIPQHILNNLRCSLCCGYLSVKPLMIRAENQQVCGKCYKLLPAEEREKCVRQIGLEAIAEVIVFPCRYNILGCPHTYGWCDEKEHEKECPYRSECLSDENDKRENVASYVHNVKRIGETSNELRAYSEDIAATFQFKLSDSSQILIYKLTIQGNDDKKVSITSNDYIKDNIDIAIEGTVSFHNTPHLIHTDLRVIPTIEDNLYESLNSVVPVRKRCSNCKNESTEDIYNCLSGHPCCVNCKGKMCIACVKTMERHSKRFCKNYEKGCHGVFSFDEIHDHEVDCVYNDIKCPLEPCNVIDVLPKLYDHLKLDHVGNVFLVSELTRYFSSKDDCFVIICYGSIFKCFYWYYKTFVELFVTYIGSSKDAAKYSYEVAVTCDDVEVKKKSRCSNWNNLMLEQGVTFTREQLIGEPQKKLAFDAGVKILKKFS